MFKKILYVIPLLLTVLFVEAQIIPGPGDGDSGSNQPTTFSGVVGFSNDGSGNYTNTQPDGWNNNMLTSSNFIASGQDGSVKYVVASTTDKLAFGLTVADPSIKQKDIMYRMLLGKKLSIWNENSMEGNYGKLAVGDILEILRVGNDIIFRKNGVKIHSIPTDPLLVLYLKVSAQSANLVIPHDAFLGDYYEFMEFIYRTKGTSCDGNSAAGEINLTVFKGILPYTYSWDNGATTQDIHNLSAGVYTVTVTDAIGEQVVVPITVGQEVVWNYCEGGTEGESLYFDGINDYIQTAEPVLDGIAGGDFTFEAWVNADESMSHPIILCNRSGANGAKFFFHNAYGSYLYKMLAVQLEGVNYFVPNNGTFNAAILDGTDHHVAVTRTGSVLSYYVDGALIGTRNVIGTPNISTGLDVRIGLTGAGQFAFKGDIGDVRVWNVARTAAEILGSKDVLLNGTETGLIANWQMKEGQGQIAEDKTNNANHAYLGSSLSNDANDPTWNTTPVPQTTYPCLPGVGIALSSNRLVPNAEGKLMYIVSQVNRTKMIGLTDIETAAGNTAIDYGIELNADGNVYIYEGGTQIGGSYGNYLLNQEVDVERVGSEIRYLVNKVVIKTTTTDPTKTLIAKTYLTDALATLNDIQTNFCDLTFKVTTAITEETPSALGSIVLTPYAGVSPYYYFWDDGDQNKERHDLESGYYNVTVVDTTADTVIVDFKLPTETQFEPLTSTLSFSNNVLTKAGVDSWTDGMATLKNQITPAIQQGEIIVEITELGVEWIYGLREDHENSTPASVYQDLDFGFYVRNDNYLFTYDADGGLKSFGEVKVGDQISIEKNELNIKYKKNDVVLRTTSMQQGYYKLDFSLKTNGSLGPIKIIKIPYQKVKADVVHGTCFLNNGSITATYTGSIEYLVGQNGNVYPTYSWTGPNSFSATTPTISNLAVGSYTVTITYGSQPNQFITKTYPVNYKVNWIDKVNTEIASLLSPGTGLSNTLVNNSGSTYGTNGGVSSNELPQSTAGWAEFTVNDAAYDYLVFGLSQNNSLGQNVNGIQYGIELIPATEELPIKGSSSSVTFPSYTYQVIESGTPVAIGAGKFKNGDKFKIERLANGDIVYYKGNTSFHTTPGATTTELIVDASMNKTGATIFNANVSFLCKDSPYIYGHLKKKLEGGLYRVPNGIVYLKYREEYKSGNTLKFNIYDDNNNIVRDQGNLAINTFNGLGDNRIEFDVQASGLSAGNYILEVINDKNEKWYLRFKY